MQVSCRARLAPIPHASQDKDEDEAAPEHEVHDAELDPAAPQLPAADADGGHESHRDGRAGALADAWAQPVGAQSTGEDAAYGGETMAAVRVSRRRAKVAMRRRSVVHDCKAPGSDKDE